MPRPIPVGTAIHVPGGVDSGYAIASPTGWAGGAGWEGTLLVWFKLTTRLQGRRFTFRSGTGKFAVAASFTSPFDNVEMEVDRATTGAFSESSDNWMSMGTWLYGAFTYSEGAGCQIYHGTETTPAAESTSYVTQVLGSGNTNAISGEFELLSRGAIGGAGSTVDGDCAYAHFIERRLTLAEIIQLQFQPGIAVAGTAGLYHPAADGSVTTLKDYSGNGNDMTRQGSGQALAVGVSVGWMRRRSGLLVPVSAGGAALVAVRDETVEFAEGLLSFLGLIRARDETVELAEGILAGLGMVRLRDETVELAEGILAGLGMVRLRDETVELAEGLIAGLGLVRLRDETVELAEGLIAGLGLLRVRDETVELAESIVNVLGLLRVRDETVELAESIVNVLGLLRVRDETVELAEGLLSFLGLIRLRNETIELAETTPRVHGMVRIRAETVELAEGFLRLLGLIRARDETVELAETTPRVHGMVRIRAETVELAEGLVAGLGMVRIRDETVELVESFSNFLSFLGLGMILAAVTLFPKMLGDLELDPRMTGSGSLDPKMTGSADLDDDEA